LQDAMNELDSCYGSISL